MTCSPARLAANIANSQRSTGPKTEAGKTASRRNALKHGLSGSGTILTPDHEAELERRVATWAKQYPPADGREAWLVRQLALATIRIDRCAQLEVSLVDAHLHRDAEHWDNDRDLAAERLSRELSENPVAVVLQLKRTSHGCDWLIHRWTALADGLEGDTCLWTDADATLAVDLLGARPELRHLDPACRELVELITRARAGDAEARTALRERIAASIAALEERAESLYQDLEQPEQERLLRGLRFDNEPDTRALRRLEAAAQRLFDRTQKELQSLQAGRERPTTPAPAPRPPARERAPEPAPPPPAPRAQAAPAHASPFPELDLPEPAVALGHFRLGRPAPVPSRPARTR